METTHTLADEQGATTAEYAACTGGAVGFACVLFTFLTSSKGQKIVETIIDKAVDLIPFL